MRIKFEALFLLAGFEDTKFYQIENGYWPASYTELRANDPWFLVKTKYGMIKIGWRKRVISIDWSDTEHVFEITKDDVTKYDSVVHAWSYVKALEYLASLRESLVNKQEK